MSDEAQNEGAATGVDSLFTGDAAAPAEEAASTAPEDKAAPSATEAKAEDAMASFRDAEGNVDTDKLFKAFQDTQKGFTQRSQKVAELEKLLNVDVPETAQPYLDRFDFDALKEGAPRAFTGTDVEKETLGKLFAALHAQGIPVEKAHAVARLYMEGVDPLLPDRQTPEALRQAAVEATTNGKVIAADVQAWLRQREAIEPFSEGQLGEIGRMLQSSDGLNLLWRLSRQTAAESPPSTGEHADIMPVSKEAKKAALMKRLGNLDDDTFRADLPAIKREWAELFPDGGPLDGFRNAPEGFFNA